MSLSERDTDRPCPCGSGKSAYWLYDGNGIELCRACDSCERQQLKKYRPEVLDGPYGQDAVDEPVEAEEY